MKREQQLTWLCGAAIACGAALSMPARAALLPSDCVEEKTVGQWVDEWWKWLDSFPEATNPLFDATGASQNFNQPDSDVSFLASSPSTVTRSFHVPADRYLLVPLVPWSITSSTGDPPEMVRNMLMRLVNDVNNLVLSVDGLAVPEAQLFAGRHEGGFHGAFPGPFLNEGTDPYTYTDGYWAMLEPLTPGPHVLVFGGGGPTFAPVMASYQSIVTAYVSAPEPASSLLLLIGLISLGFKVRR